jgi:glycosyltransferase involved in cell wall biosynthesis
LLKRKGFYRSKVDNKKEIGQLTQISLFNRQYLHLRYVIHCICFLGGSLMEMATYLSEQHISISVIIPTRNEAPNLQYVLPHLPAYINEVILVDGHSTDGTITEAQRLLPDIRIVEQTGKGKGDAIKAGLACATGDIVVLLDADGSADPLEIPRFVNALLAGNDFAKGSRNLKGGGSHDITWVRSTGNYVLTQLVNLLFNSHFSDLCYGYNVFWKHCLDYVKIDSDGFEIETLINIRMHTAGLKIAEVPSVEYQRIHGNSNLNAVTDGLRILKLIIQERQAKKPQPRVAPLVQKRPVPEEVLL